MDPNGNGKKAYKPLLRELIRRQRQDSDSDPKPKKAGKRKTSASTSDLKGSSGTTATPQVRKPLASTSALKSGSTISEGPKVTPVLKAAASAPAISKGGKPLASTADLESALSALTTSQVLKQSILADRAKKVSKVTTIKLQVTKPVTSTAELKKALSALTSPKVPKQSISTNELKSKSSASTTSPYHRGNVEKTRCKSVTFLTESDRSKHTIPKIAIPPTKPHSSSTSVLEKIEIFEAQPDTPDSSKLRSISEPKLSLDKDPNQPKFTLSLPNLPKVAEIREMFENMHISDTSEANKPKTYTKSREKPKLGSSDSFKSSNILDLTKYCDSDDDTESASEVTTPSSSTSKNTELGKNQKKKKISSLGESGSQSIPQHIQDIYKKQGAIPKYAVPSRFLPTIIEEDVVEAKPAERKIKLSKLRPNVMVAPAIPNHKQNIRENTVSATSEPSTKQKLQVPVKTCPISVNQKSFTSKSGGDLNSPSAIPLCSLSSPQFGGQYSLEEVFIPGTDKSNEESSNVPEGGPYEQLDAIFELCGELFDCLDPQNYVDPDEDDNFELSQGGGGDYPDHDFIYEDSDCHGNEIAELYSYTEQPELQLNVKAFEDQMEIYNFPPSWQRLSVQERRSVVMKLLDQLECSRKPLRMRSARCLLYIAQGCWAEVQSDTEQQHWTRMNALMLFQLGAFWSFVDLLNLEMDNSTAAHVAMRKVTVSILDSQDLRVILSVLYIITEVIRIEKLNDDSEYKDEIGSFIFEIGHSYGEDNLLIKLLSMVTRFCSGSAPHFPMKKVLLLLWKLTLLALGGMNELKELKAQKRKNAGLPPQNEDTMEIVKTMRSSSPPASASDLLEAQNQKRSNRPFRRSLMKQSSLDDQESLNMEMETSTGNENGEELADMAEYDERRPTETNDPSQQMYNNHIFNMYTMQVSPPPPEDVITRGLPWKPKVRQRDIDTFLDTARMKFLGYSLPGDQTTLFGLPEPIHEGVRILRVHIYTSLAELQIKKEDEIARNPVSTQEEEIDLNPAEIFYQAMLPNLPQYMIALLKILLAAAPTSKSKTESINIMADVLPEEMPMTVLQSMKLAIDVNRHKEIIVKAVSAILLLLLKHFKLNHIYQFEFMSQHLVFANCIPLVLKFFNQNIMGYIGAKNAIPILDFPSCVIGDQPELTAESMEIGDAAPFSWRNMFSCINLLRILNKLTKWKHSRIMMLVVFKSAPILKRTLKIRHAMTQLYVLKLLKMQTKYLGRQWRKSNMKTISAIYQKVRHRLNDDWAFGNDLDARPWDFQAEECALRASVDRFNNRRYSEIQDSEFEPVDNNPSSVLGKPHELSDSFKRYYSWWLEQEVYDNEIEWEKLLLEANIDCDKN